MTVATLLEAAGFRSLRSLRRPLRSLRRPPQALSLRRGKVCQTRGGSPLRCVQFSFVRSAQFSFDLDTWIGTGRRKPRPNRSYVRRSRQPAPKWSRRRKAATA